MPPAAGKHGDVQTWVGSVYRGELNVNGHVAQCTGPRGSDMIMAMQEAPDDRRTDAPAVPVSLRFFSIMTPATCLLFGNAVFAV